MTAAPMSASGRHAGYLHTTVERPAAVMTGFRVAFGLSIVFATFGLVGSLFDPDLGILAVGWLTTAVVLVPTLMNSYRPWSAWSLVVMNVSIGFGVHSTAMLFTYPDFATVNRVFLLGYAPRDLVSHSLIGLGGITMLTASYLSARRRTERPTMNLEIHPETKRRVVLLAVVATLITLTAFLLFARNTGGLNWSNFSSKRTKITRVDIENDTSFRSYAYLAEMSRVSMVALLLLLSVWCRDGRGIGGRRAFPLLAVGLVAVAIPIYGNVRADVLILAIYVLAVLFYSGFKMKSRFLVAGILSAALLVQVMTASRLAVGASFSEALTSAGAQDLVEPLIITQNFADIGKTAHIHRSVPEVLEWSRGDTYATWLFAPIPRDLWAGKPLVVPGPIIGNRIYGNVTSGVPPGLIGEAYWNFGYLGVALMTLIAGRVVGFIDNRLLPARGGDPMWIVIFTVGALNVIGAALSESLGQGFFVAFLNLLVAVPAAVWVWAPSRAHHRAAQASSSVAAPVTSAPRVSVGAS